MREKVIHNSPLNQVLCGVAFPGGEDEAMAPRLLGPCDFERHSV